jgi:hypothetical protein
MFKYCVCLPFHGPSTTGQVMKLTDAHAQGYEARRCGYGMELLATRPPLQ